MKIQINLTQDELDAIQSQGYADAQEFIDKSLEESVRIAVQKRALAFADKFAKVDAATQQDILDQLDAAVIE